MSATAAVVAAAVSAAAITAEATAIAAKATAAAAILAWFGFVNFQSATAQLLAVELIDSRCTFFISRHFDERESSRAARVSVLDDVHGLHRAGLGKRCLQILSGGLKREISYVKLH